MNARVTILLVEDHAIVREGLRSLLIMCEDFDVVGEAESGREAVELVKKLRPAIVVMDIALPTLNGFEATRQILAIAPKTKVIVLSAHSDDEYVAHMLSVGAAGYLVKQNSGQILVRAVREIARGHPFFSPAIARRLSVIAQRGVRGDTPRQERMETLTAREAEVLQRVAEGAANKQIAAELGISIKTVEKHRQRLMNRLNIHDTAGLTRHAIATGVIECSVQKTTR